jgi:hypothetical protein
VCTHTEAALARCLEGAGMPTVTLSLVREYSEKVGPPRTLWVPYPFGAPCGLPGEADAQRETLRHALALLTETSGPVLVDHHDDLFEAAELGPVQASAVEHRSPDRDVAAEVSAMRRYHDVWFEREHKTGVGLTGIPTTRFRGIVRFLEALAEGRVDDRVVPAHVLPADFIRYAADDLKAMYLEGRMVMKPGEPPGDAARWLWGDTALGALLVRVRDALDTSHDSALRDAAFGIAR